MANWTAADKRFMRRCLVLAQKGEGRVSPNPLVGAVVARGGRKISEGFHEKFGAPHAEPNALKKAGARARGATLYVSLEPCSHTKKKTPPCVPAIIRSGVSRVVIAAKDANPKVNGIRQLRAAGIRVDAGLFADEAEKQNKAFFKFMRTGKPFVTLKMAQSRNGKIGIAGKGNVRISGKRFDSYSQMLRNQNDAILVGIGTVLADNPRLTCRMKGGRNPARIIVDSKLSIPFSAKVLKNACKEKVIIATPQARDRKKQAALEKLGAIVLICGRNEVDMKKLLAALPKMSIISVLVEGGAHIAKEFMRLSIADKAVVCISPKKIDPHGAISSPFTSKILRGLKNIKRSKMGGDTVMEGCFKP